MEEQIKLLERFIKENKHKYSGQRRYMFRLVKWYKYPLVILSALSTIVLGLQFSDSLVYIQWQKNIALVITAGITLLTTLMTFWNVEEYWLQNKLVEQQLEMLQQQFEYEKTKGMNQEMVEQIFNSFQSIIGQQQTYWKTALEERSEAGGE